MGPGNGQVVSQSKSIESRDPIWILQRALGHLVAQGADAGAIFEIQNRVLDMLRNSLGRVPGSVMDQDVPEEGQH